MFPLKDDNPTQNTPFATIFIIALCVTIFIYQLSLTEISNSEFIYSYGMKPASLFSNNNLVSSIITVFSSMFMHGGFFHLAGNMLFLWIYGNNIEDAMGTIKFILFYCLCSITQIYFQCCIIKIEFIFHFYSFKS